MTLLDKLCRAFVAVMVVPAMWVNASEPMLWAMPQAARATHERSQSSVSPPYRVGVRIAEAGR